METTERIVEAYCRYIKHWLTLPNIRCAGQYEIDLLAADLTKPQLIQRYHIECGVSISSSFSKLTAKHFSTDLLKERVRAPEQRRTIDYYIQRKFMPKEVIDTLLEYGFKSGLYSKVIVSWGWTTEAEEKAKAEGVILWDFRILIREIGESFRRQEKYFTDDTLRTIQLFSKALAENNNSYT